MSTRSLNWAVEVELAGVQYRFATSAITFGGNDYEGGLERFDSNKVFDPNGSMSLTILTRDDWPTAFKNANWIVEGGEATIYLVDGTTSTKWHGGRVDSVSWGQIGDPVNMEIIPSGKRLTIPDKRNRVDPYTQPDNDPGLSTPASSYDIVEDYSGSYYPTIIGYPGYDTESGGVRWPVVPSCIVQASYDTYSDDATPTPGTHTAVEYNIHCFGTADISADTITILETGLSNRGGSQAWVETETTTGVGLSIATDLIGQQYKYYEQSVGDLKEGHSALYGAFKLEHGGGVQLKGRVANGASDLFEWIFTLHSSLTVDRFRNAASANQLNGYRFDTYVNNPIDAIDWFVTEILPHLPAVIARGDDGIYLAHVPTSARPTDVLLDLEEGRNCTRTGTITSTSAQDIANEIDFRWSPQRDNEHYLNSRTMTSETNRLVALPNGLRYPDARAIGNALCKMSQATYGDRPTEVLLNHVWDGPTAYRIGRDLAQTLPLPLREFAYTLLPEYYWLSPGDVISLTDADVSLTDQVCVVTSVSVGLAQIAITAEPVRFPIVGL